MKYLTMECMYGDNEEAWEEACLNNDREYQAIKHLLPPEFVFLHDEVGFHDAIIKKITMSLGDTISGHMVIIDLEDPEGPPVIYQLTYKHVFDFQINRVNPLKTFRYVDMNVLADEIFREEDTFTHEMLCDNYTFFLRFRKVEVKRLEEKG